MEMPVEQIPLDAEARVGHVLVVDDDPSLRKSTSAILAAFGLEVIEAKDGLDALEKYQAQRGSISLVIMDLTMPRMSGFETIREIRKMDPSARIILSTGYADQVPMEITPDAWLPKPYTGNNLREIVHQVLHGGRTPVPWS